MFSNCIQIIIEHCKQTDPDHSQHSVASGLGLYCFYMSGKKDAALFWVKLKSYDIKFICIGLLKYQHLRPR